MKQKTSMFGSAMSSYSKAQVNENDTIEVPKKVGRPKGSAKKMPTKSSFTTKLDNDLLSILKVVSEEKSYPINRIIEDCVKFALIKIGRGGMFYPEYKSKADLNQLVDHDLRVVADRYKQLDE